ncbi:MAG: hypothetical protein CM15mP74_06000 [Halieaceae bacterium]|nr:MAG: hypothetical protein CM15mP74_06000 [Halieaceae bacterium]
MGETLGAAGYCRVAGASDIVYSTRVQEPRMNVKPVAHPREVTLPGLHRQLPQPGPVRR